MALVHGEDQDRWYFTKEELKKTPSVLSGIDLAKELSYRQQSANLIQDMGQRLSVYPSFNLLRFSCHTTGLCRKCPHISLFFWVLFSIRIDIITV